MSHILVVEDNKHNIRLLRSILERQDYTVEVAEEGESALKMAVDNPPALILLDIMMPGINGYEVCRRLKADDTLADIPVIFISAMVGTEDKMRGFEAGAVDFITKPFQGTEVIARVDVHLQLYQQRQQIEQLRAQERAAHERITSMKDEVLRIVSHDLKDPLGAVDGSNQLMAMNLSKIADEEVRGKYEQYVDISQRAVDRMKRLIHDLLDEARLADGELPPRELVELVSFIQENIDALSARADEKDITLHFEPPAETIAVPLAKERFRQVLQNLLSNAIKYTPQGGTVTAGVEQKEKQVIIRVSDTGMGIPTDAIPHVFERFYRVPRPDHPEQSGSGLGLNIVKTIVEQHEGTIGVESTVGEGTTFVVQLPLDT